MKNGYWYNLYVVLAISLLMSIIPLAPAAHASIRSNVNWEDYIKRHDMIWDRLPERWETAPYSGNGNVGFLLYRAEGDAKNILSIHTGRHDHYDHRLPYEGKDMLWIYRGRLPLGRFNLTSDGEITGVDMRLGLWNAELTGTVSTTKGSYKIHGLSHSLNDVIYFKTDATNGESVQITWHPDVPFSSVRKVLDAGGGPKGGFWDEMRHAPYPLPEKPTLSKKNGINYCLQPLLDHRGETTTAWHISGNPAAEQVLLASVHHSFPEKNTLATTTANLEKAKAQLTDKSFFLIHQDWWHQYYPQSFLTINDAEKESFYWIQMYKLGSAMRENGPILDLMGPWYHPTFWPMVWGDLNVQLIYWTHLTSNRMGVGSSLPNNVDKYAHHLATNGPQDWKDSADIATLFPQNMDATVGKQVPDMLAWVLHNYWLHCEFANDRQRMKDGLFPVLRQTMNTYFNYLRENPTVDEYGIIHIKHSWSPEYPGGRGQDINFTIGLMKWCAQTLLDINKEHSINDPLAPEWQNILDNLVDYQIDENGLRIGKDIPFDKPHRHYSHLLPFYPLFNITPEDPKDAKMLRTSLDHWLDVTFNIKKKDAAMSVTGYTATGAASMYACLGDADQAYHYLDFLIKHKNVSSTTMYAEGNPVIESPLSFATSIHDMLLQSWGGKIHVFPATPQLWGDVAFHQFRTQGAFLVSAKKKGGITQFVGIESEAGRDCIVQIDIEKPRIFIDDLEQKDNSRIQRDAQGFYIFDLKKGESVLFTAPKIRPEDCVIAALPVAKEQSNLFGLSKKTERLPGHKFYTK